MTQQKTSSKSSSVGVLNVSGQRRMARLVQADRKSTIITQIATVYNRVAQKCSKHISLKSMGYNSRRQQECPLLSVKNGNLNYSVHTLTKTGQIGKT